jgi:membrane protein DedA with SNARE-associated domain
MDLISVVEHHGYVVVALGMFLTAAGLPLPASVLLLAAGSSSHPNAAHNDAMHQGLHIWLMLPIAWLSALVGDTLLYLGGRYTGWWLLAGMCRVSVDPENCIFRSADYFYKRGPRTLLFAKFVPGLASMAAPLAGSLSMRFGRFLRLDAMGALNYVAAWLLTGFVFSRFIEDIVWWVQRVGHVMLFVVEPHRLKEEFAALREFMAPECEIYLYCSCIRDTTSARVAHMLEKENCRTTVIEGGLKAWVRAGGPVELVPETDVRKLPQFD